MNEKKLRKRISRILKKHWSRIEEGPNYTNILNASSVHLMDPKALILERVLSGVKGESPLYKKTLLDFLLQEQDISGMSILDIGASNGRSSFDLVDKGAYVTMVEPSPYELPDIPEEAAKQIYHINYEFLRNRKLDNFEYIKNHIQSPLNIGPFDMAFFFFPNYYSISRKSRLAQLANEMIIPKIMSYLGDNGIATIVTEDDDPVIIHDFAPDFKEHKGPLGKIQVKELPYTGESLFFCEDPIKHDLSIITYRK